MIYNIINLICLSCSTDAPPPRTVTATPLSIPGKIRVSWTPPTPPNGSTITGYSIQYRIGSSGDYTTATDPGSGSTSTTISGLQLGRTYQVRVGTRTQLGVGINSYRTVRVTTYNCEFASPIYLLFLRWSLHVILLGFKCPKQL